ncbi:rifin PIR protein,putative [Plasmodium sp. DRC-Itaito]|nr:rifin PIR protein,putative [Plasmodium sp. DRC-Itaito]
MNIYYNNVLLFSLILNILLHNLWNHKVTTKPHRCLCECELYTSQNYDNDPQMKEIMENFNKQTKQRLRDDAISTGVYEKSVADKTEKICLNCGKNMGTIAPSWKEAIKKCIEVGLANVAKIVKQLKDTFGALQPDVDSDAISTGVYEKSVADKTEKICLNCGKNMGTIAPSWKEAIKKCIEVGLANVAKIVKQMSGTIPVKIPKIKVAEVMIAGKFTDEVTLHSIFKAFDSHTFAELGTVQHAQYSLCVQTLSGKQSYFTTHYSTQSAEVVTTVADTKGAVLAYGTTTTSILDTTIIASVLAIVVIVLVTLIIYLILRYPRKKKKKKKNHNT